MHERSGCGTREKQFQEGGDAFVLDGIAVHGREETKRVNGAAGERGFHLRHRIWGRRIHHHVAVEAPGMAANGGDHALTIAGDARDQCCPFYRVVVQFGGPGIGELDGILGRELPIQDRPQVPDRCAFLFGKRGEEAMGKEMDMRVGDWERSPRGLDHC